MKTIILNNLKPYDIREVYDVIRTFPNYVDGYCFRVKRPKLLLISTREGEYAFESRTLLGKEYRIKVKFDGETTTVEIDDYKKGEKTVFSYLGGFITYLWEGKLFLCPQRLHDQQEN